ncbi:MAG: hypothetical protein IJH84_07570 [Saccharopolyspora sp.]|uniref:hypothetical protein n=1 Tax=Saccharopolyspora sp. TaxID=33915 RepID=UPI0025D0020C|nr:hypothetical protein [Saccharopolyspora sp.]MBQ6640879.1 hypothetical protein [Saccharopolyspora sp.]
MAVPHDRRLRRSRTGPERAPIHRPSRTRAMISESICLRQCWFSKQRLLFVRPAEFSRDELALVIRRSEATARRSVCPLVAILLDPAANSSSSKLTVPHQDWINRRYRRLLHIPKKRVRTLCRGEVVASDN